MSVRLLNQTLTCFVITAVMFLVTATTSSLANDDASEKEYRFSNTLIAKNKVTIFRAIIETLNTYGYLIGEVDQGLGTVDGFLINYDRVRTAGKFSGTRDLEKITQRIQTRVSNLSQNEFTVDIQIIYSKKIVEDDAPYQQFFTKVKNSTYLK